MKPSRLFASLIVALLVAGCAPQMAASDRHGVPHDIEGGIGGTGVEN